MIHGLKDIFTADCSRETGGRSKFYALIMAVLLLALVFLDGCAKPDYAMIRAINEDTVKSNQAIMEALANAEHKQASVGIFFDQETLLPAGTRIHLDTWYDMTHAVKFNDTTVNAATEAYKAEAREQGQTARAAMNNLLMGFGIDRFASVFKTAFRTSGDVNITADNQSTATLSGGMGDRFTMGEGGSFEGLDIANDHSRHLPPEPLPTPTPGGGE
jgi:hypothetical protein